MTPATKPYSVPRKPSAPSGSSWLRMFGGAALIAIVTLAIYWPALRGGFILDDEDMLQRCGDATWQQIWFSTSLPDYWPFTESMLHLEWQKFGYQTLEYHLVNVVLHIGAAVLLWRILKQLAVPGAFVAALLFAVHPVNVESVAWIAQRKNTLAMLWFLLSAHFYLRADEPAASRSNKFYYLSILCFVLALLSKIAVVVLPPILLLLTWWQRRLTKRDTMRVAPFFAAAIVFSLVNIWFMSHANAEGIRSATPVQRVLGAAAVTWFYLYKAVFPIDLAFVYPKWIIVATAWKWWLALIAALLVTLALWVKRNTKLGRIGLVAWLFFTFALAPVMGLSDTGFMKYSLVADHYEHIAIIGVVALSAAALAQIRNNKLQIAVVAMIALALSAKAFQQATIYRDPVSLYRAAVAKNPGEWMLHGNLADELLKAGDVPGAIAEFHETLRLNPQSDDAHYFYGLALEKTGDLQQALVEFGEVLKLPVERYKLEAHHEMAAIYVGLGNKQEALAHETQVQAIAKEHGLEQVATQSEQWMKVAGLK